MAIYAIDFDGTLAETRFPAIIGPKEKMVKFVKAIQAAGHKTILWTSRVGEDLDNAVEWCREQGIIFDAVNKPLPEQTARWGNDTRKIYADYYIDDKAMTVKEAESFVDSQMKSVEIKKERDCMNGKEVFDFLNAVIDQTKHGSLKWEWIEGKPEDETKKVKDKILEELDKAIISLCKEIHCDGALKFGTNAELVKALADLIEVRSCMPDWKYRHRQ